MNDLISRQAAIEAIKTWGLLDGLSEGQAIEILADEEKLPSAQQPARVIAQVNIDTDELISRIKEDYYIGEWIPCSERLPEKSGRYLVTNTRLGAFEVTWNIFYNGKGEAPEGWLYEDGTIAWMPLPEPYKGEES